ncbi:hypothetical protein BY996DRAFT_4573839 [Phakopsora pachyrhizi]|nr:hypothetical protein BY996DRAFT_4573839 [Phakopsora pachyrhizi]
MKPTRDDEDQEDEDQSKNWIGLTRIKPAHSRSEPNLIINHHHRSSSFFSRSALNRLHNSFPRPPIGGFLPTKRTSFVHQATINHSRSEILWIAIKKWIVVFCSVHIVVSSGSSAFALVRLRKTLKKGNFKSFFEVIKRVWLDRSNLRLSTFLGLYSALWTLSYPELLKLQKSFKHLHLQKTNKKDDKRDNSPSTHYLTVMKFISDWPAAFAGCISGLSLIVHFKEDRVNLASNIFCRGLYTILNYRPLVKLKYGDILLFGISNAQIMQAFVLYPESLPSWYWNWIKRVGSLDKRYLELHRNLNLGRPVKLDLIRTVLKRSSPRTSSNQLKLDRWLLDDLNLGGLERSGVVEALYKDIPCAPCFLNHPMENSCSNFNRTWISFQSMLPTYAILHLIPSLLFRRKVLFKDPIKFILSILKKTSKSSLFISSFVWIILYSVCIPSRVYELSNKRIRLRGWSWNGFVGFMTCLSLFWEDPRRRSELALYCAPEALVSIYKVLKNKRIIKGNLKYGEIVLSSLGTGMMMHVFINEPSRMTGLIRGIIDQLVDPHLPGFGKI